MLNYISPINGSPLTQRDNYYFDSEGNAFPLINGIPRFIETDNYANAFGHQWTIHQKTQLDSVTETNITTERLERCLGAPLSSLKGKYVLEAGAGAGRFTELIVKAGALTHSFDLSKAVDANASNIGNAPNYRIAQASIYSIPFPDESFDYVFCIGVIQHTPDPEKTITSLFKKVKPGGKLIIDHYTYSLARVTKIGTLIRLWLRKLKPERSKKITDRITKFFFPMHWAVRKIFPLQALLSRISPVLFYYRQFPQLSKSEHLEFSILDTYDHLTDYYKHLRTGSQLERHLKKLGAKNIEWWKGGNGIELRCEKP